MDARPEPSRENGFLAGHAELLLESFRRLTGRDLLPETPADGVERGRLLYESPLVVMSHGTEDDPLFNYANLAAQRLFEMDWATFVRTPSRYSAESVNREERARLLAEVTKRGFIDDYRGGRIASSGRRFSIEHATVWNLVDAAGVHHGQAAMFAEWTPVDPDLKNDPLRL